MVCSPLQPFAEAVVTLDLVLQLFAEVAVLVLQQHGVVAILLLALQQHCNPSAGVAALCCSSMALQFLFAAVLAVA